MKSIPRAFPMIVLLAPILLLSAPVWAGRRDAPADPAPAFESLRQSISGLSLGAAQKQNMLDSLDFAQTRYANGLTEYSALSDLLDGVLLEFFSQVLRGEIPDDDEVNLGLVLAADGLKAAIFFRSRENLQLFDPPPIPAGGCSVNILTHNFGPAFTDPGGTATLPFARSVAAEAVGSSEGGTFEWFVPEPFPGEAELFWFSEGNRLIFRPIFSTTYRVRVTFRPVAGGSCQDEVWVKIQGRLG